MTTTTTTTAKVIERFKGNIAVSQCKEWLKLQRETAGTWQTEFELWELYPFKENGLSRASFSSVLKGLLVCIA